MIGITTWSSMMTISIGHALGVILGINTQLLTGAGIRVK